MKQHLMRNINTISRCAALYRDAHLADCGLSGWQAPYIPEICAAPGITQDQLALRLHVVTLKSALKDDSLAQLDALRDALIASLMAE